MTYIIESRTPNRLSFHVKELQSDFIEGKEFTEEKARDR